MDFDSSLARCQSLVDAALERGAPTPSNRRGAACRALNIYSVPSEEGGASAAPTAVASAPADRFSVTSEEGGTSTGPTSVASAPSDRLSLAVEYALSGGKRLRPYIVFSVAEMLGREARSFLDAACAVEFVHTSSLILDDLPCMDDSWTRRGRASLHCEFDEATAILAAVSLLSRGFASLAENASALGLSSRVTNRAMTCLAETVGASGMVAGQMAELLASAADLKTIEVVHDRKTGSLFVASGQVPAILAGASEQDMHAIGCYAHHLGLAYQIADDISDAPATGPCGGAACEHSKEASTGRREHHSGLNVASLLGLDEAARRAHEHIQTALAFLEGYGESACPLRQLAAYVLSRIG